MEEQIKSQEVIIEKQEQQPQKGFLLQKHKTSISYTFTILLY